MIKQVTLFFFLILLSVSASSQTYHVLSLDEIADSRAGAVELAESISNDFSPGFETPSLVTAFQLSGSSEVEVAPESDPVGDLKCQNACTYPPLSILGNSFLYLEPFFPSTPPLDRSTRCKCVSEEVNSRNLAQDIPRVEEDLEREVRRQVNTKLFNKFSVLIEDLHFFTSEVGTVFHPNDKAKMRSEAGKIRCNDPELYREAISRNEKCRSINDKSQIEGKLSEILSVAGSIGTGNFETILGRTAQMILGPTGRDDCRTNYTRECHDNQRRTQVNSGNFQAVNRFLSTLFKDNRYRELMQRKIADGHSPLEALELVIKDDMRGGKNSELSRIINPTIFGNEIHQRINAALNASGDREENLLRAFEPLYVLLHQTGRRFHPGFAQILESKELFTSSMSKISRNDQDLLQLVEHDQTLMKNHFIGQCEQLARDFAEASCIGDDELLANLGDKEVLKVPSPNDNTKLLQIHIACTKNALGDGSPLVEELYNHRQSDYFLQSNQDPKNQPRDLYSHWKRELQNADGTVGRILSNSARKYPSPGVSISEGNMDYFGRRIRRSHLPLASGPVQTESAVASSGVAAASTNNYIPNRTSLIGGTGQNFDANSFGGSRAPSSVGETNPTVDTDPRNAFQEFMRDRFANDEGARQLASTADDSMMAQLMELRREMEANQARIVELTSENERLRLQEMQNRIEELERERRALEPGDPSDTSTVQRAPNFLQPAAIASNRNIPSASSTEVARSIGSSGASVGTIQEATVSPEGGRGGREVSAAGSLARATGYDSSSSPVVVSASTAKSGTIEIRSQEVGLDLLNYLSRNGSDLQTLINLKTSGVIYRYQLMENGQLVDREILIEYKNLNEDVQKIIDKKISENTRRPEEVIRREGEISSLKRVFSYNALQFILAEQVQQNQRQTPGLE